MIKKILQPTLSDTLLVEFIGQPGSGKSSIIETLCEEMNVKDKATLLSASVLTQKNKIKKIKVLYYYLNNPLRTICSVKKLISLYNLFINVELHAGIPNKLRRIIKVVKNIVFIHYLISCGKKITIVEGLAHHLHQSDTSSNSILIDSINELYGCSEIWFVQVDVDPLISVKRMIERNNDSKETKEHIKSREEYFRRIYKERKEIQDNLFSMVEKLNSSGRKDILAVMRLDAENSLEYNAEICEKLLDSRL